jgi:hypothetical protein
MFADAAFWIAFLQSAVKLFASQERRDREASSANSQPAADYEKPQEH